MASSSLASSLFSRAAGETIASIRFQQPGEAEIWRLGLWLMQAKKKPACVLAKGEHRHRVPGSPACRRGARG